MSATDPRELSVRSADGTRLHVEVHGPEGAPTVVLSHGWTCSTRFWNPVITALGEDLRIVVYDQRGHGRSAAPHKAGYSTSALADDICAVLDATVPSGTTAVLAGHSMGGMTLMAASERPQLRERAAALLLASTGSAHLTATSRVLPGSGAPGRIRATGHKIFLTAPLPLGPVTPVTRAALRYVTMAPDADRAMVDFCVRLVHDCPPMARGRWGGVLAKLDLDRSVGNIEAPTTVLGGTVDRLTPISHAHRIADMLPRCEELIEIPGAGHMTPLEAPDRVADTIRTLVSTHLSTPQAPHKHSEDQKEHT